MIKKNKCQQFSKIPQMAGKKTCDVSYPRLLTLRKINTLVPTHLAIYPPVAILLSIITAITEQYNYTVKTDWLFQTISLVMSFINHVLFHIFYIWSSQYYISNWKYYVLLFIVNMFIMFLIGSTDACTIH